MLLKMTRVLKCEIANHMGVITDIEVPTLPRDIAKKSHVASS